MMPVLASGGASASAQQGRAAEQGGDDGDDEGGDGHAIGAVLGLLAGGTRGLVVRDDGGRGGIATLVSAARRVDELEDRSRMLGLLIALGRLLDPRDLFAAAVGLDRREGKGIDVVGEHTD